MYIHVDIPSRLLSIKWGFIPVLLYLTLDLNSIQ